MRTRPPRYIRFCCGAALAAVSIALLVHGARTSAAQALYFRSKYVPRTRSVQAVLSLNEQAFRLYPFNIHSCSWAALRAHREALLRPRYEEQTWCEIAEWWCDRGLSLYPRRWDLCRLKSQLLARRDPAAAARYWEAYVEWHFWEPSNQVRLVELYAAAGELDKARGTLALLKARPDDYARAAGHMKDALRPEDGANPTS